MYAHLYDFVPVGYFNLSENGLIEKANLTIASMLEMERGSLLGKRFTRFVLKDDQDIFYKHWQHLLETEQMPQTCELRLVKKDGQAFYIRLECMVIKNKKDELRQIRAVVSDITEHKLAEEVLKESNTRLELATAASNIGHWDLNLLTNEAYFSTQWKWQLGYKDQEIPNLFEEWESRLHPDDHDWVMKAVMDYVEGRSPEFALEFRLRHKDGTYRWIYTRADKHFDDNGRPCRIFGCHIDNTERKTLEEDLLRAQKLESVGTLAGGIAHDFNNLLTTILGNVSMAKLQVSPEDEIFNLLSETETASVRAQTLTKQLLTFAKGGTPVKENASIRDILKESCSFVLRGSKSDCEFSITKDLWSAEVDVGQISHVINNIVINANQAMPEGGIILVTADNLIEEGRHDLPIKPGRYIKISIKDQGVGIAENHLLNIFDPYFTTKEEGSGLGLATSYFIIKKHNGHIAVDSRLGVGTTFHIYLPASDKIVPEKEKVVLIKGQGRILVMDDEASLRKMVGRMLKNLGYEAEFAKDGAEAIRMVKESKEAETPYDAVVLDLTIPGKMGGKEAINKLLEIDPAIKAIVSSGYSDDPVLANFHEFGFKGRLPKPFESRSLGKVLHEVIKDENK